MRTRAWTVYLHNYTLRRGASGMRLPKRFRRRPPDRPVPGQPDVRAFVSALTADIASKGVATVVAESHYHGLEHGFHHERYFIELGTFGRYLLGLCFCEHCMAAQRRGVQAERLRIEARSELERRFSSQPEPEDPELVRERVGAFAGGELQAYSTRGRKRSPPWWPRPRRPQRPRAPALRSSTCRARSRATPPGARRETPPPDRMAVRDRRRRGGGGLRPGRSHRICRRPRAAPPRPLRLPIDHRPGPKAVGDHAADGTRLRLTREPCCEAGGGSRVRRRRGRLLSLRLHAPRVARSDPCGAQIWRASKGKAPLF